METFSNNMGIILIALLLLVIGWLGFLQYQIYQFKKKRRILFGSQTEGSVEEILNTCLQEIKSNAAKANEIEKFLNKTNKMAISSIQKVGIVRFNPFSDTGGDLSFAVALLDYQNNGVVLSSLHSREGTRIYAKPILNGQSKYNLSEEEQEALKKAMGK